MSVYKRGGTYWFNFNHQGRHYQKSAQTGDRNEALKRERHFRAKIENAEFGIKDVDTKDANITLKDLFDGLERNYRIRGILTPRNISNLKLLRASFKESQRALGVTSAQIDAYIEKKKNEKRKKGGYKPASINRMTGMLGLAYKLAAKRGEIEKKDIPYITHLSETGNEREGFFNEAEFRALQAALPADLADFALFAYLSSWRKNEISTLKWSDISNDLIRLRAENAKDRKLRTLPIAGQELTDLIERRRKARVIDGSTITGYVFHRDGKPIREFRKAWATACKKANLAGRLVHDLRRSGVVNMIDAGVPVTTAMSISGHRTFSMFKRYGIPTEGRQREAIEAVQKRNAEQREKVVAIATGV